MTGQNTPQYNHQQLDDLFLRIQQALGPEVYRSMISPPPRRDAFWTAIKLAINAMGDPVKVEDAQILGAVEIADEVWPVEAEIIASAIYGNDTGQ